jgi:excisionase family DNA binding protein
MTTPNTTGADAGSRSHVTRSCGTDADPKPRRGPISSSLKASDSQRLLSAQQVAIETGLPYTTIRKIVHQGALRRVVLPGSRRWWLDRRDVERFIESAKTTGTAA